MEISDMPTADTTQGMDLKSLQYFVRAAETGSFSHAALSFGVAQSALSRHLAQLEALTKAPLFFRTGRGVKLTDLGQRMLPKAAEILRQAGEFVDEAVSLNGQPEGLVRIGLLPGICGRILSKLTPILLSRYPKIRLSVFETHSGDVEMMLSDGRIDLGLYNRYRPIKDPLREALYTGDMFLVGRAGTDVMSGKSVRFSRLAELPLIMPRQPNSMRSIFDEIAARKKLKLNVVLEVNPSLAMQQVLRSCDVYATLPSHGLTEQLSHEALQMRPITHPTVKQTLYIEATRHHPMNSAALVVMHHTRLLMQQLAQSELNV
jgi:LysR family transcriptional regulator, nitrogen assimilation regulatory protein